MKMARDIMGKTKRDTCTLDSLCEGSRSQVVSVTGDTHLRRRLLEMGFCNGATVEVIRRAPLGDPIEYKIRGYRLSLRREQAKHVHMAKLITGT